MTPPKVDFTDEFLSRVERVEFIDMPLPTTKIMRLHAHNKMVADTIVPALYVNMALKGIGPVRAVYTKNLETIATTLMGNRPIFDPIEED